MKRFLRLAPVAALLACGSNPSIIPSGDFSGPTGLAIAPLPERDLLFVANQGANELRAIVLCSAPPNTPTTCTPSEDGRFLPGPIRLLAGSILVGERPLRLAGVPLLDGAGVQRGAVLVAGSESAVHVVDAANLFAASRDKTVRFADPRDAARTVMLPAPPVDVVAAETPGSTVTAVVATEAPTGGSAALTVLTVSLDAGGLARAMPTRRCTLDFVPTRLALIPGKLATPGVPQDDLDANGNPKHVYVADGTPGGTPGAKGDGAVEVSIPDIPAIVTGTIPACTVTRRLPASDPADSPRLARPLRSLALSPAFVNPLPPDGDGLPVAAGSFLLGVTTEDKALCTDHGSRTCPANLGVPAGTVCVDHGTRSCGRGRLILIRTNVGGQSSLLPAPPTPLTASGAAPMVPVSPPTPAREVAFLGRASCPPASPQECTGLRLLASSTTTTLVHPPLIGLASTEDGTLVFLDVVKRRFFNDARDTGTSVPIPTFTSFTLTPAPAAGTSPTSLAFPGPDSSSASKQLPGWINAGVTRSAQWRVVWHGVMPGLESLGGKLSRAAGSAAVGLRFPPGKSLAPWRTAPELQLGAPPACTLPYPQCVGDFVRVLSYSRTDACPALSSVPAFVDVPIAAIDADGLGMQLQAVPGFDPGPECFASGDVGGTFEVHAGTTTAGAWTVFEGLDALGRLPHGLQFVITGPRVDYPLDPLSPPPGRDVVVSFTVSGLEPTAAGTFFSFTVNDGQTITGVRDGSPVGQAGFAGPILVYSSARHPDQVAFTALTGSNSLMQATPAQFGVPNSNSVFFFY